MNALDGLRVIEVGGEIAAPYATKLLCELGADIVKVEPADGDPLRAWGSGGLFRYLNGGKRSTTVDLNAPHGVDWLRAASAGADLVIESLGAGELERLELAPDTLVTDNATLAIVRISDFGQAGPYVGIPTSGLTLQALGGWVSSHGVPARDLVQVGARIHEYTAGTYAAAAALTATRAARRRAAPVVVDLSVMECLVGTLAYPMIVLDDYLSHGLPPPQSRWFPLPGIVRCRDGWVGVNALTGQHFVDACTMIGVEEYGARQPELAMGGPLLEEFFERIQPWFDERDAQEVVELSQAFRVPAAPVGDGRMMLDYEQFRQRPFFVEEDGVTVPGPPYRLGVTPAVRRGRAPELGNAEVPVGWAVEPRRASPSSPDAGRPFDGLRVVDLGSFWAGPYCTMYLAAWGAEVVKVESTERPDGFRFSGGVPEMGEDWYDRTGIFAAVNLSKRGLTLDLSHDDGRGLLLDLVRQADVVLENYSARVVEQFGLGYDDLTAVKPDLIMVRMPGFGLAGPWRDYVGWAMVIEQATGMASVTGPPEVPMHPGGLADPVIGMHAATAVQAALAHRERTGEGQLIEVAQLETGSNLTADLVIEWSTTGEALPRLGNRDRCVAPQGVYRCRGQDSVPEWVAITVVDDVQWLAVCELTGHPEWVSADLAEAPGRRARHRELDEGIGAWAAERDPDDAVHALRARGIPAARVLTVPRMYDDPQLAARDYYVPLDHAKTGVRRYPGWPMRFSFSNAQHRFGAPTLGQHNHEVLAELGLTPGDIDTLERDGVVGDRMPA